MSADHHSKVRVAQRLRCATPRAVIAGVVAVVVSMTLCASFSVIASAETGAYEESTTSPQITVTGDATRGHTFWAYKIANYIDIKTVDGKPVSSGIQTLSGSINTDSSTLSDGSVVGGSDHPLNFKQTLALEIAVIEKQRTGRAPKTNEAGLIGGIDPLHWASARWQTSVSESDTDPWFNTNTQTTGPFRTLADWLEGELGVTETNTCVAETDTSCFGLYFDQETGIEYPDGTSRAVFDLDDNTDPEISKVIADHPDAYGSGLYILLEPHPQDHYGSPVTSTNAPSMILGTRIPVTEGDHTTYYDLYNVTGTEVLHRLGTLNFKGDTVGVSLEIDNAWKRQHPTYPMGELVPYVITTNIPYFDNFLKDSGHADYEGGRTAGSALADGTPILNAFGNQAAALQDGGAPAASYSAGRDYARSASQHQTNVGIALFQTTDGASVFQAADAPKNPVRFDITLDYRGSGLGKADPNTMTVKVGVTTLQYRQDCELGTANTATPCFAFRQSASNAQGEQYFVVQLPDWVLRANGGKTVTVQYEQRILVDAADDNGSIATKEKTLATVEFTNNSYMHDYTDFTDAAMFGSITSAPAVVFTFPLTITKVDSNNNATLADAAFTVSANDVTQCFTLRSGVYHRTSSTPCAQGETSTLTTDDSGRVRIKGLEAHSEYRVRESKQPQGYSADNLKMVDFTVTINPSYNSDTRPTEVLATEYVYAGASYLHPNGLPAYLRPATNEWVNDVDHIKHTFYAHEVDVLNGKTSNDVDAIAPFPWDVLAKTGTGMLLFALVAGALFLIGILLKRRRKREADNAPA